MKRAWIIFNPVKVDRDDLTREVARAENQYGWEASEWRETTEDDPGVGMTAEAVTAGADMVIACGGDGTVRVAAEQLSETGIPLAIVPRGTGNLLARNVGLPLEDIAAAVDVAFGGTDRVLDLGRADMRRPDGEWDQALFTVMAGVGLDAQMIVNTDDDLKKKAGWLAYVKAITASLKGGHRLRIRLRIDGGRTVSGRVHTLIAANCGELVNEVALVPDAVVDDGKLDLVALRPSGPIGWIQVIWKVVVEHTLLRRAKVDTHTGSRRSVRYQQGERFDVALHQADEFELDGDLAGEVIGFTARILPKALTIRVEGQSTSPGR